MDLKIPIHLKINTKSIIYAKMHMLCFRCQKCVVKNVNLSSLTLKSNGGSVWESNPPTAGSLRPTGFEVQASHQTKSAPSDFILYLI